jgi:hypothetical protein
MSDPAQSAARPPAAEAPAPKRPTSPARWLDRLSAVLLSAGLGGVIAAAAPSLLRAADSQPPAVEAPAPELEREPEAEPSPPPAAPPATNRGFMFDFGEPRITDFERLHPDRSREGRNGQGAETSSSKARVGHARVPLTVRERADSAARKVAQVEAGARVIVIRESGEWVQVMHEGQDDVHLGWTKRRDVAIP